MRIGKLMPLILGIVLFVSWMSVAFYPSKGDYMSTNPGWNGLRGLAQSIGARVVDNIDAVGQDERGKVLISIPGLPYRQQELDKVGTFLSNGGTLLLADDFGYGNQVLEGLDVQIKFTTDALVDPYLNYRNQWFPRITDIAPELQNAGVHSIVLNHASALEVTGPYEILARSSDISYLVADEAVTAGLKGPFPVAARATLGRGTVIVISDASMLVNSSMSLDDNLAFVKALVSFAGENPEVIIDGSHLSKTPLDLARNFWDKAKGLMAAPYIQVLLVGAILALTSIPVWRKGRSDG